MEIVCPSGQCRTVRGVHCGESLDSASKSTRHSTSQELQWKYSVPVMAHCNSSLSHVTLSLGRTPAHQRKDLTTSAVHWRAILAMVGTARDSGWMARTESLQATTQSSSRGFGWSV